MAVNLTKPEDFTSSSTSNAGSSDSIALLPPTCFESTVHQSRSHEQLNANLAVDVKASNDNSWKELTAARNEILQLQLSLQQERESKQLPQDARPAGDVSQTNQPQGLDDVIVRQATKIAELKQDFSTNKASYRSQIEELEGWLASQVQKVASLETALEIEKEKWQEEVKGLRVRVEEEQRACEEKCREVEARLEESLQTRAQMEERLSSRERELQTEKTTLEDERSELKSQLEEKMAEVVKLKAYIGKGPVDDLPTNEELQEQTEKISRLVGDNERLTTQVGLLEVRLGAITQILTIQEKEMADVAPDVVSPAPGNLLTRWREKVYQLLVQQTSAELVHKKDLHDAECKVREVTKSLTAADSRDQILKHTIERDRAELDMARSELVSARQQVSELDMRRLNDRRAIDTLKTFMER
ncbi:PREDICTED: coiled-coil alpha-helical rod protein 1-like [Priapulus caudatus]|uniref:Coiled-coil alpha-helical rod protein 1 n=1 Tax=Priapulus caudatus TaxID=37621 RepID=A0ABM1EJR2_PRICU|nr:PREDICTED: coiled-coil alpha-helical rod protein 1-like [Priapulus caudatus]